MFSGESCRPSPRSPRFATTRHQLALASRCFYFHAAHQLAVGRSTVWSSWFQFEILIRRHGHVRSSADRFRRFRRRHSAATGRRSFQRQGPVVQPRFSRSQTRKVSPIEFNLNILAPKKLKKFGGNLREIAAKRSDPSSRTSKSICEVRRGLSIGHKVRSVQLQFIRLVDKCWPPVYANEHANVQPTQFVQISVVGSPACDES